MLKRTPLNEIHKQLGARMVEFGGWEMPVQYIGVIEEHRAVRNAAGLFDISHMGEVVIKGPQALDFVNYVTTNDVTKFGKGQCQYAVCCDESGDCVDDVISYCFRPDYFMIVVNASNADKDFEWFKKHNIYGVDIQNRSDQWCQLAVQGPMAEKILANIVDFDLRTLQSFKFCEPMLAGKRVIFSRTGYTGEDGFEIYGAWDDGPFLWDQILGAGKEYGIQPVGLAARDTLRLEAAYSLYGHEISETINPLEARLGWVVKLDKSDFIGKKALQQIKTSGVKRSLVGLEMIDNGIPRQGYEVLAEGKKIGFITSGTYSPTLEKAISLALVETGFSKVGCELQVQIRKQTLKAKVVPLPFYKRK